MDNNSNNAGNRGQILITQNALLPGIIKERHLVAGAGGNAGDLVYSNSSGGFSNLGIGTNGYLLSVLNNLPAWIPRVPIFGYAVTTADQNHTSATFDDITGMSISLALGTHNYTVVAFANQGCGVSNTDTQGGVRIVIDSDNGTSSYSKPEVLSGTDVVMPIHYKTTRTGTITVKMQAQRQSGTGNFTTYNAHGTMLAIAFPE